MIQTSKWQRAHRCAAAFVRPQLGGLLAAGEEQTALMLALAQGAQQLAILGVARAIGARRRTRLHQCLDVVEDQQAAPLTKELHQPRDLVRELLRWRHPLIGDYTDGLVEQLREWRAVSQ